MRDEFENLTPEEREAIIKDMDEWVEKALTMDTKEKFSNAVYMFLMHPFNDEDLLMLFAYAQEAREKLSGEDFYNAVVEAFERRDALFKGSGDGTAGAIAQILLGVPAATPVIVQKDAEGNGYSPASGADTEAVYVPETTWFGEVLSIEEEGDEIFLKEGYYDEEEGREIPKNAQRCVVIYPIN